MAKSQDYIIRLRAENKDLKKKLIDSRNRLKSHNRKVQALSKQATAALGGFFGVGLSLAAVGSFSKAQFELIKRTDALNKSLQAVTESSYEFQEAQKFLSKTASNYGVDIFNLTQQYVKFKAAIKDTSLEGEKGEQIFDKITRSGAMLSLSNEQLEGTFRALEQMISKGNVQAEEIRGQLSERLPGAYKILAKSMGITTRELNEQLKSGKVLAEDVLPKFADQLLITYGSDKVKRIDTVTAAQNRLSNAWNSFIASMDSGDGVISNLIKNTFTNLSAILSGTAGLFESNDEILKRLLKTKRDQHKEEKTALETTKLYNLAQANGITTLKQLMELEPDRLISNMADKFQVVSNVLKMLKQDQSEYNDLVRELQEVQSLGTMSVAKKDVDTSLEFPMPEFPINKANEITERYNEFYEGINSQSEARLSDLNSIVEGSLEQAIGSFAEGLATGGLDSAFAGLFKVIGSGLKTLGSALIAYGVSMDAFKKAFSNPYVAIAAGAAAIAAGAAVQNAASNLSSPTSSSGGGSSGGGGSRNFQGQNNLSVNIQGTSEIRGDNIYQVYNQQVVKNKRVNGG